jgi:hypothetical protein
MDIFPRTFGNLLNQTDLIIVPIFQRTYCWTQSELSKWWRDVSVGSASHGVGKAVFKGIEVQKDGTWRQDGRGTRAEKLCLTAEGTMRWQREEAENGSGSEAALPTLICVDGQQRLTTTMLLLAAIRDRALCLQLKNQEKRDNTCWQQWQAVVDNIDHILFRDVPQMRQWAQAVAAQEVHLARDSIWSISFEEGEILPFSRLCPSFIDRYSYFEQVMMGTIQYYIDMQSEQENLKSGRSSLITIAQNDEITQQEVAKKFFNSCVESMFTAEEVTLIVDKTLHSMRMMYCEIISEVNLPQVFLWLQEKTLLGMGALLYNPSRGINFEASDMARNLLLSTFSGVGEKEQERLYRKLWLEPLELPLRRRKKAILVQKNEVFETCSADSLFRILIERWANGDVGYLPPQEYSTSAGTPQERHGWVEFGYRPEHNFLGDVEIQFFRMLDGMRKAMPGILSTVRSKINGLLLYGRIHSCFSAFVLEQYRMNGTNNVRLDRSEWTLEMRAAEAFLLTLGKIAQEKLN